MNISQYNQCVDTYADGVYRFVLKQCRDEELANDIVQDSFLKMWEKISEISGEKAKSYLFTTAYHTLIDRLRKDQRKVNVEDISSYSTSTSKNDYSDVKEILDAGLAKLPEIQKSVLLLRDYEGYSYEEIGEIMNLNESQVKVYIFRARLALKNFIKDIEFVI